MSYERDVRHVRGDYDYAQLLSTLPTDHAPAPPLLDLSQFIFHYAILSSGSVQDTLSCIARDLAVHSDLHDWDSEFHTLASPDPVKRLANYAVNELSRMNVDKGDYMASFSVVQEVRTCNGVNRRKFVTGSVSKKGEGARVLFPARLDEDGVQDKTRDISTHIHGAPRIAHGRIVEIKEHISDLHRSSLLILQLFCLRLHDEEFTFIRSFIQRHVLLETLYKEPDLFQASSPSEQKDKCYNRLTFSFHLPHLLLESAAESTNYYSVIDRSFIEFFGPKHTHTHKTESSSQQLCLYKAASSVLLTLATPEEQPSREEAHSLLSHPEALWTVIIVNGNWRMATTSTSTSHAESSSYQAPLAQFIRGICSCTNAQRTNMSPILHELREQLRACEDESLFDDREFSKSRTYHWIIKTCHEICTSVQVNIRFLREFREGRMVELKKRANPYERPGLEYWTARLREEVAELDRVQMEVNALREQVRELREALHGATALMESRIAIMQGDRIKTLTYLSIAYIPLSTVSAIYSMSVLPSGANFASFFIVLALTFLLTLIAAIIIQKNTSISSVKTAASNKLSSRDRGSGDLDIKKYAQLMLYFLIQASHNLWSSLQRITLTLHIFLHKVHRDARNRTSDNYRYLFPLTFTRILALRSISALTRGSLRGTKFLFWDFPWDELGYTANLLVRPPTSVFHERRFSIRKFVVDIVRFVLLPVWLGLVVIRGVVTVVALLGMGLFRLIGWVLGKCWA